MAFLDQTLQLSTAQAVTVTATSTNVYDVTGAGVGVAPALVFGQGVTNFGADIGVGDGTARPTAYFNIGTTFTGGTSIVFSVQAAVANGNAAGTYTTITETAPILTAALVAGTSIVLPIPPYNPQNAAGELLPRFYRLNYTVVGTMTAGNVTAGIALNLPQGFGGAPYPSNFTAA